MRVQRLPIDSCEARPRDLIERIASALPQQVRADYYREMAHCRVLPESDEMLRILRAMQFLALLIEQAPGEVAAEREQLTRVLEESVEAVDASNRASMEYLRKLEDRIIQLPQDVSDGIRPEMVAQLICQDLRARFADVPQTVATLAGTSRQMKDASTEFQRTAEQLTGSYRGVAEAARVAIDQLQASIGQAAATAQGATRELTRKFNKIHTWTVAALCVAALSTGMALGVVLDEWMRPPAPVAAPAPQVAPAPAPSAQPAEPAPKQRAAGVNR